MKEHLYRQFVDEIVPNHGIELAVKLKKLNQMFEDGFDPNFTLPGHATPLCWILLGNHPLEIALELLEKGADINAVVGLGTNALHYFIMSPQIQEEAYERVLTKLIDGIRDINCKINNPNPDYVSLALFHNRPEIVEKLLNHPGMKLNSQTALKSALETFERSIAGLSYAMSSGCEAQATPSLDALEPRQLIEALQSLNTIEAVELVKKGVTLTGIDEHIKVPTLMHFLMQISETPDALEFLGLFLKSNPINEDASLLVSNVMLSNKFKFIEVLLQHGFKINLCDIHNNMESIKYLSDFLLKDQDMATAAKAEVFDLYKEDFMKLLASSDANSINIGQVLVAKYAETILPTLHEQGSFKAAKEAFTKAKLKFKAKYHSNTAKHDFLLANSVSGNELGYHNPSDMKIKTKTIFKDGAIYQDNELLNTQGTKYVISKNGTLYVDVKNIGGCHSYFLKGKEGDELYGYGKPIACGGMIKISNGKITHIDNYSGHYKPSLDHLKVTLHYLFQQNVLDADIKVDIFGLEKPLTLQDIESLNIGDIVDQYAEVHY